MSTTYLPNTNLGQPATDDRSWDGPLNANAALLDAASPLASLNVATTEVPSASLNIKVAAGRYVRQDGTIATPSATTSMAMNASATNYVYLDLTASGALAVNTGGFPTTPHVRLAIVATNAMTITSITDVRVTMGVLGPFLDGVNWTFGTTTGTQIGTAANQKIGFLGATPVVQQTLGAKTAGSTYGTNEQTMLQLVYNLARAFGLGS